MGIRALEYRDQGDDENSSCVTKKAFILQYIIKRLRCFVPQIGTQTYTESFEVTSGITAGDLIKIEYSGYRIAPSKQNIPSDIAESDVAAYIVGMINGYHSSNVDEVYATATYSGSTITISVQVSPRVTTTGQEIVTEIESLGPIMSSNNDGALSDTPTPRLTNDNAKKLIGILDAYCGCQCKDSASEITNDSISKILAIEP